MGDATIKLRRPSATDDELLQIRNGNTYSIEPNNMETEKPYYLYVTSETSARFKITVVQTNQHVVLADGIP